MLLQQREQIIQRRDDQELQLLRFELPRFEIGSISDQGGVILRMIRLATTPTAVDATLNLRHTGAIARRIERQRDVTQHG